MDRRKLLATVIAVAVLFAFLGWFAGRQVKSPAQIATEQAAPTASLITVKAEKRTLEQTVVLRATVSASSSSSLSADSGFDANIVTATPKATGDLLNEGDAAIEIVGRPIIVLEGILPTYRSFGPGVEGPDVKQLQESLNRIGLSAGTPDGVYDATVAAAVGRLYKRAGYKAPTASESALDAVTQAEQELKDALARKNAPATTAPAENSETGDELEESDSEDPESGGVQTAGVQTVAFQSDADADVAAARENLARAQQAAIAPLPAHEIKFIRSLPQNVQSLKVEVGQSTSDTIMTISGSELKAKGTTSLSNRQLLSVGDTATLEDAALGINIAAKIEAISDNPDESGRFEITLEPSEMVPDNAIGSNLKVTVPIVSSGGKVLAVPLAALSTDASGSVRVEVERTDGTVEVVTVRAGLRADGFVAVEPIDGTLEEGDRLVVGRDLVLPGQEDSTDSESNDDESEDSSDG